MQRGLIKLGPKSKGTKQEAHTHTINTQTPKNKKDSLIVKNDSKKFRSMRNKNHNDSCYL